MEDLYFLGNGELGSGADLNASIDAHNAQAEAEWEAFGRRRNWTPLQLQQYRYGVEEDNDGSAA